ncbi:hypothetical protein [Streptomyces sp. 8N616]
MGVNDALKKRMTECGLIQEDLAREINDARLTREWNERARIA